MKLRQKLSVLLAICMLAGLLPWSAVPVRAETGTLGEYTFKMDGDWYLIETTADFNHLAYYSQTNDCKGLKFRQTRDIDDLRNPIGTYDIDFAGTYDGGGYLISRFDLNYLDNPKNKYGLFRGTSGATISNVRMIAPRIPFRTDSSAGISYVGGLVGYAMGSTFTNCIVYEAQISAWQKVGAVCGYSQACYWNDCYYYASSENDMGAFGGRAYGDGDVYKMYSLTLGTGLSASAPVFEYNGASFYGSDKPVGLTLSSSSSGWKKLVATPESTFTATETSNNALTLTANTSVSLQSVTSPSVTVASGSSYSGEAQTPAVTVTLGGVTLTEGTDYVVSYSGNVNAGTNTATAAVTARGAYIGTVSARFSIAKAPAAAAPEGLTGVSPTSANGSDGKITGVNSTMEYDDNAAFSSPQSCSGDTIENLTPGSYYVRVKGDANHESGAYAKVDVPSYTLKVSYVDVMYGKGSGHYTEGDKVTIEADAPPQGKLFMSWWGADDLVFTEGSKATAKATFIMPAHDVLLTAEYGSQWAMLQRQFDEASTDAAHPTEITLTEDVVASEEDAPLTIAGGRYVTLDLAGHTIDRGLSESADYVADGYVIQLGTIDYETGETAGSLTLTDSSESQTGKITGGRDSYSGGGVYVRAGSTFTMNGGTIAGNAAGSCGGGVYSEGTVNLSGGTITQNAAGESGGGVYTGYGSVFNLSGGPDVTGNTRRGAADNVCLDGVPVTLTAPLTKGARLGISAKLSGVSYFAFTSGWTTHMAGANSASFFTSDDPECIIEYDAKSGELILAASMWAILQLQFDAASTDAAHPTKITLTEDVVAGVNDSPLTLSGGRYVTLDLAGHTIDRGLSNSENYSGEGNVIQVGKYEYEVGETAGSLTLTDSSESQTGKITGGRDSYSGGVYVLGKSTFTMNGGTIVGNAAGDGGGGVYNGGTFIMNGGTITENSAGSYGGGVYNDGTFTMTGGTITKNTVGENGCGGGVYTCANGYGSVFNLSGGPDVTGNTRRGAADNVYLYGMPITLAAPLTKGARLGISTEFSNVTYFRFTNGWTTHMAGANAADFFTSDDPATTIECDAESGELMLLISPWTLLEGKFFVAGVDLAADEDHTVSTETAGVTKGTAVLTLSEDGCPVLTLTGFCYEGEGSPTGGEAHSKAGSVSRYAAISYSGPIPLTIKLTGKNSVTQRSGTAPNMSCGLYSSNGYRPTLNFIGDGSLTLTGGAADTSFGLYCNSYLCVEGAAVDAYGGAATAYSCGVECDSLTLTDDGRLTGVGSGLSGEYDSLTSIGVLSNGNASVWCNSALTGVGGSVRSTAENGSVMSCGIVCSELFIDCASAVARGGSVAAVDPERAESIGVWCESFGGYEAGYHTRADLGTVTVQYSGKLTASGETQAVKAYVVNNVAVGLACIKDGSLTEWHEIPVSAEAQSLPDHCKTVSIPAAYSVQDGWVTAPAGAVLICAEYDASGRLLSVKSAAIPAGCFGADAAGLLGIDGLPTVCKLMLVDGKTYAPLCEAWSRDARK